MTKPMLHALINSLSSRCDRRIAMALSKLHTCTDRKIESTEAVHNVFPEAWKHLQKPGVGLTE